MTCELRGGSGRGGSGEEMESVSESRLPPVSRPRRWLACHQRLEARVFWSWFPVRERATRLSRRGCRAVDAENDQSAEFMQQFDLEPIANRFRTAAQTVSRTIFPRKGRCLDGHQVLP